MHKLLLGLLGVYTLVAIGSLIAIPAFTWRLIKQARREGWKWNQW